MGFGEEATGTRLKQDSECKDSCLTEEVLGTVLLERISDFW